MSGTESTWHKFSRGVAHQVYKLMPDKAYISWIYRRYFGRNIDWENPQTFNEKTNWMKLYDRNPLYTQLADKYEVKKYVAEKIGSEHVIPTLGVWDCAEDIRWDSLPKKFVLKCTHDSGSILVCKDPAHFDRKSAAKWLSSRLSHNYWWDGREWCYKDIKPRVIAEQYIEDSEDQELRDYKFYCFNGTVKALLLASNRQSDTEPLTFDYFDADFQHLPLTNHYHPQAKVQPHRPEHFEEMRAIAEKLSEGFPEVRVDLYEANGCIYFSEFTFYDNGGFLIIHPDDWDLEWGKMIDLSLAYQKN